MLLPINCCSTSRLEFFLARSAIVTSPKGVDSVKDFASPFDLREPGSAFSSSSLLDVSSSSLVEARKVGSGTVPEFAE